MGLFFGKKSCNNNDKIQFGLINIVDYFDRNKIKNNDVKPIIFKIVQILFDLMLFCSYY
jgi:hypothetical protein